MKKTFLIIKREYLSRVKKKSFIVITLLVPVIIALFFAVIIFISIGGSKEVLQVGVLDESGIFNQNLRNGHGIFFRFVSNESLSHFRKYYQQEGFSGALYIPKFDINHPSGFTYYAPTQIGLDADQYISDQLDSVIEDKRLRIAGLDRSRLENIRPDIDLNTVIGEDQKEGSTVVALVVGYCSGFLIYFSLMFFGMMTMRGVMEEKTNRIAEVIISSVKPFQLMVGKIIGIAGVGLTQYFIWIILVVLLVSGLGVASHGLFQTVQHLPQANMAAQAQQTSQLFPQIHHILNGNIDFGLLLFCFFFYFLFGYLMYASLFAAVGACVDQDATESQSLTLPVTMPIVISFIIMLQVIQQPNSTLAVAASIFPLSSPLVMIARIPFGVPWIQLVASFLLLIGSFILMIWVAGKIYRTGILLYGKKVTLKEMGKWLFRKN